jgi:hypothetical protein
MRWLACLAIVLAACNSGDTDENPVCGPNGMCPMGFTCNAVDNRCYRSNTLSDARPVDAASGAADARPGA